MTDHIEAIVMAAVAEESGFAPSAVRPEMRLLDDLRLDSLDRVEIALAIEDKLDRDVEITSDQITDQTTVADLVDLVRRLVQEAKAR